MEYKRKKKNGRKRSRTNGRRKNKYEVNFWGRFLNTNKTNIIKLLLLLLISPHLERELYPCSAPD